MTACELDPRYPPWTHARALSAPSDLIRLRETHPDLAQLGSFPLSAPSADRMAVWLAAYIMIACCRFLPIPTTKPLACKDGCRRVCGSQ